MVLELRRIAAAFARAVGKVVFPKLAAAAERRVTKTDAAERLDAPGDELEDLDLELLEDSELDELLEDLEFAGFDAFNEPGFSRTSNRAAKRVVQHSQREFSRLGINVEKEPHLKWLIDGWRKDNVARITGMQKDQLAKIERILREGRGHTAQTLAKEIARQLDDVTLSRAEALARDQILTLNANITRERQTAAGIDEYIWTTSNDERVRPEHKDLEGARFTWADGHPEEGHPGEPINCRCIAYPVLPELEEVGLN